MPNPLHPVTLTLGRLRITAILAAAFLLSAQSGRAHLEISPDLHSVATVIDSQGTVWNLTQNTLYQLREGRWQQVGQDSMPDEPTVTNVTPLQGPEGGVFWVTTKHATENPIYTLYVCRPGGLPLQVASWSGLTGPAHTLSMKATRDGSVWIGSMDSRLRHWSPRTPGVVKTLPIPDALFSPIPSNTEFQFDAVWEPIRLLDHPNGNILFWSEISRRDQRSSLRRLSGVWTTDGNSFQRIGEDLPDSSVQTAALAPNGDLWVATDNHGLWRVGADGKAREEPAPATTEKIQHLCPGDNWIIAVSMPEAGTVQRHAWFRRSTEAWRHLGTLSGQTNLPRAPIVHGQRWLMPLEYQLAVVETDKSSPDLRLLDWRNDWTSVRLGSLAAAPEGLWGAQTLTPWNQLDQSHPSVSAEYLGDAGLRAAGRSGLWASIDSGPASVNRAQLIRHWYADEWRDIPRPADPKARHASNLAVEENGTLWLYGNQITEVWTRSPEDTEWTKHQTWAEAIDACGDRLIEFITPTGPFGRKPLVIRDDRQGLLMVSEMNQTVSARFNKIWRSWSFRELGITQLPRRTSYGFDPDGSPWIQTGESHRLVPDGRGGWRRIDKKAVFEIPDKYPPGTDQAYWDQVRTGRFARPALCKDSQGVFWFFERPAALWFKPPGPSSAWQRWNDEQARVPWRANMVFDSVAVAANGDRFMFGNRLVIRHDNRLPPPPTR